MKEKWNVSILEIIDLNIKYNSNLLFENRETLKTIQWIIEKEIYKILKTNNINLFMNISKLKFNGK